MDIRLKQRLIGITVLSVIVLMISPIFLDADGRIPQSILDTKSVREIMVSDSPKQVSTAPKAVTPIPEAPLVEIVEKPKDETLSQKPVVSEPVNKADNPTVEELAVKQWALQVASFRDASKASQFRIKLVEASFQAYVRERKLSDGSVFTQVFVGPVASKIDAEQLKILVKDQFNEQGLVVRFKPE